jgi:cell division protein FtsI/penicillin-binding protein 2
MLDAVNSLAFSGIYTSLNNIYADPTLIVNPADIAQRLSGIVDEKEATLVKILTKRPARYVRILKRLSFAAKEKVDNRIASEATQIKKGLLDEKDSIQNFIILNPVPSRFYPEKELASQLIGFVDNLGEGRYGIE